MSYGQAGITKQEPDQDPSVGINVVSTNGSRRRVPPCGVLRNLSLTRRGHQCPCMIQIGSRGALICDTTAALVKYSGLSTSARTSCTTSIPAPRTNCEIKVNMFDGSYTKRVRATQKRKSERGYTKTRHLDGHKESVDLMGYSQISLSCSARTLRGYDPDDQSRLPYAYRMST